MRSYLSLIALVLCASCTQAIVNTYQQQEILYWHNKARSEFAALGQCANMVEMVWDNAVANVANAYTEACSTSGVLNTASPHNANRDSYFLNGFSETTLAGVSISFGPASAAEQALACTQGVCLGENWAGGGGNCPNGGMCAAAGICGTGSAPACESDCSTGNYCTIENMVYQGWFKSETVNSAGQQCLSFNSGGGHCSQVLWQNSEFVGCDWFVCSNAASALGFGGSTDPVLLCDYGPLGNFNIDGATVNVGACTTGAACSACDSSHPYCVNGLCARNAAGAGTTTTTTAQVSSQTTTTTRVSQTTTTTQAGHTTPTTQNGGVGATTTTVNGAGSQSGGSSTNEAGSNSGSSGGAVAGIIIAALAIIGLAVAGAFVYVRRLNASQSGALPSRTPTSNVSRTPNLPVSNPAWQPANKGTNINMISSPTHQTRPAMPVPPPARVPNKPMPPSLPAGWTEEFDPSTKQHYYFNATKNISSWEKPKF